MSDMKMLRVLYVEDDDATREALAKFLSRRVGKLWLAADGEEGIEKFVGMKPNLMIVDLIMPGMSGLDLISEIRKIDKECKILITSTIHEVNTVIEAVDLGIEHYIIKPIDMENLEKKLIGVAETVVTREGRPNQFFFENAQHMGAMEDEIRKKVLRILKNYSGKGPQDLKVLLFENQVEITIIDALTPIEKTVIGNRRNLSSAEQFRRIFYEEISCHLEEIIQEVVGFSLKILSISIDASRKTDKIILTIV